MPDDDHDLNNLTACVFWQREGFDGWWFLVEGVKSRPGMGSTPPEAFQDFWEAMAENVFITEGDAPE